MASIRERFPGPWKAEPIAGGYVVVDAVGARLAYLYAPPASVASATPGRSLTEAEARSIAQAIAKLGGSEIRSDEEEAPGERLPYSELHALVRAHFASALKSAREAAGYSSAERLAVALGISPHTYRQWERGDTEPDLKMIERLCLVLNVTPNDLVLVPDRA